MKYLVVDVAAESYGAMSVLKDFYNFAAGETMHEWVFVLSGPYLYEKKNIKVIIDAEPKRNWVRRYIWEKTQLPRIVKKISPDRIISLQNITVSMCKKIPQLLYMHMPLPFQKVKRFSFFNKKERILFLYQTFIGKMIVRSIKKADITIVQGEWLKKAICEKVNAWDKIKVFPTEINLPRNNLCAKYATDGNVECKQFIYPVAPSAFKNHECIIEAVKILIGKGFTDFKVLFTFENHGQFEDIDQIHYLGRLSREDVFTKMEESVLLFPSFIETFGMPLLEARACGCIEIVSDCPFSHEILDDYGNAYFFNPFDCQELATLMECILTNSMSYKRTKFEFSQDYSWGSIMQEFERMIDHGTIGDKNE